MTNISSFNAFHSCLEALSEDKVSVLHEMIDWITHQDGEVLLIEAAQSGAVSSFEFLANQLYPSPIARASRVLTPLCKAIQNDHAPLLRSVLPLLEKNILSLSRVFIEVLRSHAKNCFVESFQKMPPPVLATGLCELLRQEAQADPEFISQIREKISIDDLLAVVGTHMGALKNCEDSQWENFDNFLMDLEDKDFSVSYPLVHAAARAGHLPFTAVRYSRNQLLQQIQPISEASRSRKM